MTAIFVAAGQLMPAAAVALSLAILWLLLIVDARRLERGLIETSGAVATELQAPAPLPAVEHS